MFFIHCLAQEQPSHKDKSRDHTCEQHYIILVRINSSVG